MTEFLWQRVGVDAAICTSTFYLCMCVCEEQTGWVCLSVGRHDDDDDEGGGMNG